MQPSATPKAIFGRTAFGLGALPTGMLDPKLQIRFLPKTTEGPGQFRLTSKGLELQTFLWFSHMN